MYQQADEGRSGMSEFFDQLTRDIEAAPCERGIIGLSESEIDAVRSVYGQLLPAYYLEFLRRMGSSAGVLWMGTDAFYPEIMKIKSWALELLSENKVSHFMPETAIVIAIHQGYQVYWLEPSNVDDPPAATYIEGSSDIGNRWDSFSGLICSEAAQAIALWPNKEDNQTCTLDVFSGE